MAKRLLYMGTHGPEDPTKAALVFSAANGARAAGLRATVALVGDAVLLMREPIPAEIKGLGRDPLNVLIDRAIDPKLSGPQVYVLV